MRWVVAVLVCGCNQVFGIDPTVLIDAPPAIDAPPPPVCPVAGTGALPTFSDELQLLPAKACESYTPSDVGAFASCDHKLATGAVDGMLAPVTMAAEPPTYSTSPRITPEGDRLFMVHYRYVNSAYQYFVDEYGVDANGAWARVASRQLGSSAYAISAPIRGTGGRFLVQQTDPVSVSALVEYVPDGPSLREVIRTPLPELALQGTTTVYRPNLSPDGLRLVFTLYAPPTSGQMALGGGYPTSATYVAYYADRPSIDVPFGVAQEIPSMPAGILWPYITNDCGRVYFSALNTVFYLKQ